MKPEYDFAKGGRGKFYHPDGVMRLPVYLEPGIALVLQQVTKSRNLEVAAVVNEWLQQDIALIEPK